jgi:hypothetical protein
MGPFPDQRRRHIVLAHVEIEPHVHDLFHAAGEGKS